MKDPSTIIDRLRHFASLEYRYQVDDALASLESLTANTLADLNKALSDDDPDVRVLAIQILDAFESDSDVIFDVYEPKLTVEQLITLLREPHPDHDFFDREPDESEVRTHAAQAAYDITGTDSVLSKLRDVGNSISALRTPPHSESLVSSVNPKANAHRQGNHATDACDK